MSARALPDRCQPLGLGTELLVRRGAQRADDAARLKQRGAEPLGDGAQRCATLDRTRLGKASAILGGKPRGGHGQGHRRRDITRDALERRPPCGKYPLGGLEALQARVAASCGLGNGAPRLARLLDSRGTESTVAAPAALAIDTRVLGATATETRLDRCAPGPGATAPARAFGARPPCVWRGLAAVRAALGRR